MKEQSNQTSFDTSGMQELSPDSRVWQRISDSVGHHKRQTRVVRALSVVAFLVVSACAGIGYFTIIKGTNGGAQFSENLDMRPLSETVESDPDEPQGDESLFAYFSSVTQAYFEANLTSDELETLLECIHEVNATLLSEEASPAAQLSTDKDTDNPEFNFRYEAHSQCLKKLKLPRLKARYAVPETRKKPI